MMGAPLLDVVAENLNYSGRGRTPAVKAYRGSQSMLSGDGEAMMRALLLHHLLYFFRRSYRTVPQETIQCAGRR